MPDVAAAATFTSSEPMLDAVWALCAHSGLYTSQEQFIDTPTREKGQFLWDAANESQTVMRTFGEQNLSWQGLRDMARAQARYWPTTGQVNEVYPERRRAPELPALHRPLPRVGVALLPVHRRPVHCGRSAPDPLRLSDYLAGIIDTSTGLISGQPMSTNGDNEYGYDYDTNADTTLNILAVDAFRRIGDVAALVGDGGDGLDPGASGPRRSPPPSTPTWSARDGLYVDGLRTDGTQSTHSSQLANVVALAYGVVPAARMSAVAAYVASLDISVEPDHGMELLRALHAGGRDADMVRILTDPSFPGWAAIIKAGGTFTWETWTPSDLIGDSMSHGWGSSALVAIQEALLGAVPTAPAPGGPPTLVTVTPPPTGSPTPRGRSRHRRGSTRWPGGPHPPGAGLQITVPPNAAARCRLPGPRTLG